MTTKNAELEIGLGVELDVEPLVLERLGRLEFDAQTFALKLGVSEDSMIFGRLFLDSLGEYRTRWAIKAPPPAAEGATAVDLTTGTLRVAIREPLGSGVRRALLDLGLGSGLSLFTDGSDGIFAVTFHRNDLLVVDAGRAYTWESTFTVGDRVLRLALGEFLAMPSEADVEGYDREIGGAREFDQIGGVSYLGEAPAGSATSDPVWRIRRYLAASSGETVVQFADGNRDFDNVWDDRLRLGFS